MSSVWPVMFMCLVNDLSVAEPVLIPDVPVLPGARRWVELRVARRRPRGEHSGAGDRGPGRGWGGWWASARWSRSRRVSCSELSGEPSLEPAAPCRWAARGCRVAAGLHGGAPPVAGDPAAR